MEVETIISLFKSACDTESVSERTSRYNYQNQKGIIEVNEGNTLIRALDNGKIEVYNNKKRTMKPITPEQFEELKKYYLNN